MCLSITSEKGASSIPARLDSITRSTLNVNSTFPCSGTTHRCFLPCAACSKRPAEYTTFSKAMLGATLNLSQDLYSMRRTER